MAKVPAIDPTTQQMRIPTVRQRIDAPIQAFGGGNQGLAQVGRGLQAVGAAIEDRQKRHEQVETQRRYLTASSVTQKYLHDPEEGVYNTRKGAASPGLTKDTQDFLNQTYVDATRDMTERQKLVFDQQWSRLQTRTITNVSDFESREFTSAASDTNQKTIVLLSDEAAKNMSAGQMFSGDGEYNGSEDFYTKSYVEQVTATVDNEAALRNWTSEQRSVALNEALSKMYTDMAQEMVRDGEAYGIGAKDTRAFIDANKEFIDPRIRAALDKQAQGIQKERSINNAVDATIERFVPQGKLRPPVTTRDEALAAASKKYANSPNRDNIMAGIRRRYADFEAAEEQDRERVWSSVESAVIQSASSQGRQQILSEVRRTNPELFVRTDNLIKSMDEKRVTTTETQIELADAVMSGTSPDEIQVLLDEKLADKTLSADDYEKYKQGAIKGTTEKKKFIFNENKRQIEKLMKESKNLVEIEGEVDDELEQEEFNELIQLAYDISIDPESSPDEMQALFDNAIKGQRKDLARLKIRDRMKIIRKEMQPSARDAAERRIRRTRALRGKPEGDATKVVRVDPKTGKRYEVDLKTKKVLREVK